MFKLLKDVPNIFFRQPFVHCFGEESGGNGGAASGKSAGSQAGTESVDGAISDMKLELLQKLPEEERKVVLAEITSKVKNLQSVTTKKSEKLSEQLTQLQDKESSLGDWLKIKEQIDVNPELGKILTKTWENFNSGKLNDPVKSTAAIEKDLKTIDRLITQADDLQAKEDLRRMRTIIQEETGSSGRDEKIKKLEEQIAVLSSATRLIQTDRASKGIEELTVKFGKDIVDKYSARLKATMPNFPQKKDETSDEYMEALFLSVATPQDRRTAFQNETKLKTAKELVRKKRGLEPLEEPALVGNIDKPRDKAGKVIWNKFIPNILRQHGHKTS